MNNLIKAFDENNIELFEELMDQAIENDEANYHEVILLYIRLLISNDRFEDAQNVLITELSVPYIDKEYQDAYNELLDVVESEIKFKQVRKNYFTDDEIITIFSKKDNDFEKTAVVEYLLDSNVRNHLEPLAEYLKSPDGNPTLKTLILDVLISQEVNQIFEVEKFNDVTSVNPSAMVNSVLSPIIEVGHAVFYQTLDDNPSQLNMAEELLRNYVVGRFPFIEELNVELLCASIHGLVLVYNKEIIDFEYLQDLYNFEASDIETSLWEVSNFLEFVYET
jgi:hypothetical protein